MEQVEDRSTWDSIYHALFNETLLFNLFYSLGDKEIIIRNLHNYFKIENKSDENFYRRYVIDSILKRFGQSNIMKNEEIVIYYLNKSPDQVAKALLPYITSDNTGKTFTVKEIHNISFFLLAFYDTYPGAYKILYNKFKNLIESITISAIYECIGQETLWLLKEIPSDFANSINIDPASIVNIFSMPIFFTDPNFTQILQTKITNLYLYPNQFPKMPDLAFSCMNTTISLDLHFMDLMNQMSIEYLTSGDYNLMISNFKLFQTTIPYFLVAHHDLIYKDLRGILPLLNETFQPSRASQLVARFRNDYRLLEIVQFLSTTAKRYTLEDLVKFSIPFLVKNAIGNSDLINYSKLRYFTVSDRHAKIDFDFIKCYAIFKTFFSILTSPPAYSGKFVDQIGELLGSITIPQIREIICIDIFSLLFMKKNDAFIFNTSVVRMFIKVLSSHSTNQYIANASQMFQKIPFWQKDPQFQSFFERNPQEIFESILSQKWDRAGLLTQGLPMYRRLFLLAYGLNAAMSGNPIPEESKVYENIIRLEYELNSKDESPSCAQMFPQYSGLFSKRRKLNIVNADDMARAQNDLEAFYNCIDLGPLLQDLHRYKSLYDFSFYLNEYRHVTNSNKLDICRAVLIARKSGNTDFAEKICKMAGKTVLEVMLERLEDIDESFIRENYSDHKLEMITLAITHYNPSLIFNLENVPSCIKSYVRGSTNSETSEQRRLLELERLISESQNVDDVLFTVPHRDVLISLLRLPELNEVAYDVLQTVEYTAVEEEISKVLSAKIKYVLSSASSTDAVSAMKILTEKCSKDTALFYLKTHANTEDIKPIEFLLDQNINDNNFVAKIIEAFPTHFRTLLQKFGKYPETLKIFERYCPQSCEDILSGYKSLPSAVLSKLSTVDKNSIISVLVDSPTDIFLLSQNVMYFLDDFSLEFLIESIDDLNERCKVMKFLSNFFGAADRLNSAISKVVNAIVKRISINSIESEDAAILQLNMALSIARNNERKIIQLLINILRLSPFSLRSAPYDFSLFGEESFGMFITDFCSCLDFIDVGISACEIFGISADFIYSRIAFYQLRFGLYNEAKSHPLSQNANLDHYIHKGWNQNSTPFLDATALFIMPLMKATIAPPSLAKELLELTIPISPKSYAKIEYDIYNKLKQLTANFIQRSHANPGLQSISRTADEKKRLELVMHAKYFVLRYFSISNTLSCLVMMHCMSDAYQTLFKIENQAEAVDLFMHYFYLPAISALNASAFCEFMHTQDPTYTLTASFWDGLLVYLREMQMNENLAFVYNFRKMHSQEAIAILNLFPTKHSSDEMYRATGRAFIALEMALQEQHNISDISYEELRETYQLVGIQLNFYQFLYENKREKYSEVFDLVHNPSSGAKMAAILLLEAHDNAPLYQDIMKTTGVDLSDIIAAATEIINEVEPEKSLEKIKLLKGRNPDLALQIIRKTLPLLCLSKKNIYIPQFIFLVDDLRTRALLFIEYDCLGEASELVHTEKMADLNTLVAYRASQTGSDLIVLNFVK